MKNWFPSGTLKVLINAVDHIHSSQASVSKQVILQTKEMPTMLNKLKYQRQPQKQCQRYSSELK